MSPDHCDYEMFRHIGYSSWLCPIMGGVISQDICRRACRYCPKEDWEAES